MMRAGDMRKVFIGQVEFVNKIANDMRKHDCCNGVVNYAKKWAHVENECGEFWRITWGGAYAYVDIDGNGKPTGNIWWSNEDLGCSGGYTETVKRLSEMTDEEILGLDEVQYFEESDTVDDFLPLNYEEYMEEN